MENCHPITVSSPGKSANAFTNRYPSFLGLIILLLPKCPLCVVAYGSAITLCGSSSLITHTASHPGPGAYFAFSLGILVTGCILFSLRSARDGGFALMTSLCGMVVLGLGLFSQGTMTCYYAGALLLVFASLTHNGSVRKIIEGFRNLLLFTRKENT